MNTPKNYANTAGEWIFGPITKYAAFTPYRMCVLSAAPNGGGPGTAAPAAGGIVDGIGTPANAIYFALPGLLVMVEAGGAFGVGADLQADSLGRAVLYSTGVKVMRALEAASAAGDVVQAVFSR